MSKEQIKQDILDKIRQIASETGEAPGQTKFASTTGIKDHIWRGRFWRGWGEALTEAGFSPKEWTVSYDESDLLAKVSGVTAKLGRFPSKVDLQLESANNPDFPSVTAITSRWNMSELASAVAQHCDNRGQQAIGDLARNYAIARPAKAVKSEVDTVEGAPLPLGYVYMQRHDNDFKIGFTNSLNKRGRQIQIELPKEIELVHSILTDDPAGVEAYWHRRFADKRTRGEWFKLTKADVAAFKKWSKIW